jgi:hypothetical protein
MNSLNMRFYALRSSHECGYRRRIALSQLTADEYQHAGHSERENASADLKE